MRSQEIAKVIQKGMERALRRLNRTDCLDAAAQIEQPANPLHGDYSSNIALQLARSLQKPPMKIAALIQEECELLIEGAPEELPPIGRIEVAAPGFLNVYIDWTAWALKDLSPVTFARSEKIIVEHTSVNPNKSMHIGHLRNSCIGDTLARLLRKTGSEVEVHYYVDDLGNQLADTLVGLREVALEGNHSRFGDYCWDVYAAVNRAYEEQPELLRRRSETLHELEQGGGSTALFGALVAERIIREHLNEMKQFGIRYDVLIWESAIVREGLWDSACRLLRKTPNFVLEREGPQAGCWVLKTTSGSKPPTTEAQTLPQHKNAMPEAEAEAGAGNAFGCKADLAAVGADEAVNCGGTAAEKGYLADKVLVRSNGILTYTAKDIAYHLWKFGLLDHEFGYSEFGEGACSTNVAGTPGPFGRADAVVNVIDVRQEYPQQVVREALRAMGCGVQAERLHHASYGVVSLSPATAAELGIDVSDGRSSYAMSGRQGVGIKVSELVDRMERQLEVSRNRRDGQSGLSSREIAISAIRYYLLRFSLGTEIVFDINQATEISGNTGVYLMYAYARASNVLAKGRKLAAGDNHQYTQPGKSIGDPSSPAPDRPEPAEMLLMRAIAGWTDALETAARELAPNLLCAYAHQLATQFNQFYTVCPILKSGPEAMAYRLWLTGRFADTLREALEVLGVAAPERL